jgi:EAL and modified HD-GYP domain-containing signal transduction protein
MFKLIRQWFGHPSPQINEDPFGRALKPPPQNAPSFTAPPRITPPVVLQRDEIIDDRTRIAGYRFAARLADSPYQPNARATLEVLGANNIAGFAERRLALIQIQADDWLNYDYRPLIGPRTTFLLDWPDDSGQLERWRSVAASIRAAGAHVALAGVDMPRDRELIYEHADLLLIDYSAYSLPNFERAVTALKHQRPQLELLAENIGSWPERRYCVSLGVTYGMGPFTTCQDEEQQSGDISQSRLVLIEMLNLLRGDADLAEIAALAKRDPGVTVKLVAMANSPLLALSQSVASIDQAIMVLGREQLYRWLSIAVFRAGAGSPRDEVLLELALGRGRFLELIGHGRQGKTECDELFLLGLLSLLDSLLGVPMIKVVERLHLSAAMRDVLLHSEGPLGRYLMLSIAVEKGRAESVGRLAEQLAIPLADIETASAEALNWAEDAARLSQ